MNLQPHQYNCIGILAKHCDLSKICVAENEASNFDLYFLFCDFWFEIEEILSELKKYEECGEGQEPENYQIKKALFEGGHYIDCRGKKKFFDGVFKTMAYYSYSRYIILNGFNDTANGLVTKSNEFSIPKSLKELESFSDKYREMGLISFERTVKYICKNSEIFNYSNCPKEDCGCEGDDCKGTKAKGYGFRSKNINK